MQWITLFRKEMLENWRNYKWIWMPLVIILLAIMDPISTYYLPQIIESVGGLPDGASIDLPLPSPHDAIMMSLAELSSLGVLIIVLMAMGTISGERKYGVAEIILAKPVPFRTYITTKWAALLIIVWVSLFLGMVASWYYTNLLFGNISFIVILQTIFFYGLWLTLVITITIFYNTLLKTPGLIAACTIITIMIMSIITKIFDHILTWSPQKLSSHIHDMLMSNEVSTELIATSFVTLIFIGLFLTASILTFKTKEIAH